ncbi:MAG: hypothetical protein K940chlam8_00134 [Chlamydiae bacterium]|nr:hypothetical protein [Chlamydiota bacterium]
MATVALDTINTNFESETFSIGESAYSYFESDIIQSGGFLSLFPTSLKVLLPTIDVKKHQEFRNKITQLKEDTACFYKVVLLDSKSDYKSWGLPISFTSYVIALPFKQFTSNPDVFDFFTTRELCKINHIKRAPSPREGLIQFIIKQIPVTGTPLSNFVFNQSIQYQYDETAAGLVGFEKSLSAMKEYKQLRQENNKMWKHGSIFSRLIARFTLDKDNNDYFNTFTPSIDRRIKNLETRFRQIQIV